MTCKWYGFEHDGKDITRVWEDTDTSSDGDSGTPHGAICLNCGDVLHAFVKDELTAFIVARKWLAAGAPMVGNHHQYRALWIYEEQTHEA